MRQNCLRTVAIMLMLFVAAACSEREDPFFPKGENPITFSNPYTETITKAAVPGQIRNPYSAEEKFVVYAHWEEGDFTSWEAAGGELYMNGVEVSHAGNPAAPYSGGSWASETDYYWPESGKLTFAAYSPADAGNDCAAVSYDASGLTLTDFTISTNGYTKAQAAAGTPADGVQYDLMYADRVKDKTGSTGTGPDYNGVDINFKHILSSIQIKVKTDKAPTFLNSIKLEKVSIGNVYGKGTFEENIPVGETAVGTADWTIDADFKTGYDLFDVKSGVEIGDTAANIMDLDSAGKGCILLPQKFEYANGSAFDKNKDANIFVRWSSTVFFFLKSTDSTWIDLKAQTPLWEKSKCYIYNVTITTGSSSPFSQSASPTDKPATHACMDVAVKEFFEK